MSIEGYSFGVTFFDVVGSAGNTVVYFLRERRRGTQWSCLFVFWERGEREKGGGNVGNGKKGKKMGEEMEKKWRSLENTEENHEK